MTPKAQEVSKRDYTALLKEVAYHDRLYYEKYEPEISDYEYDQLIKKLEHIEKAHPEWITPDSPTQRIGDPLTKGFVQVAHEVPMLSLANTYSEEEIADFIKRVNKLLGTKKTEFCVELKMDGVAVSVRYEKGKYVRGITRGNGKVGDDITANLRTISSLPLTLEGKNFPDVLEIRGEVFMPLKIFQRLNQRKEEEGEAHLANPRNAAAGSLKLLDPREVSRRKLQVVFYGVAEDSSGKIDSQYDSHQFLQKLGLPCFAPRHRTLCSHIDEIFAFADKIEKERRSLPFEIDGIVIKVDDLSSHVRLGKTSKTPRSAVAYKFAPEQESTKIREITVQVGRTGVLTPVAELDPVFLAGSTISRATLHNQDEIERKDIRVGDTVLIEKGGDVIPKVVSVDKKKRPKSSVKWAMPTRCPSCGTKVVHVKGEVAVRCPNRKGCPDQRLSHIAFFASKQAMDIEHLGEKIVSLLVEKGLVHRIADLYDLTEEDLFELEGFKEKSVQNLLNSIDASRKAPLSRLIIGLGIKYVGAGAAELLSQSAGSLEKLAEMSEEELLAIDGIGEKTAESIVTYFADPLHLEEIELLKERGVKPQIERPSKKTGHPFYGKTFVLTGALEDYTRDAAAHLIKERGGKVSSSVSSKTDFVLVGEDPGSKLKKAESLGVKLLDEKQFEKML